MRRRVGAYVLLAFVSVPLSCAAAAGLPEIKAAGDNVVPKCATPGRLMEYIRSRNPDLDARYENVATEYMRYGEKLGVRWDYAFFQMIIETGSLSYRRGNRSGDVKPAQNNFAGLGATGGGESGESFKDIPSGVRAHLEHLLLYAGDRIDNPIAERTRKVQEWGVLTDWQSHFKRPITFADLAAKWAPGTNSYRKMLEAVAERFQEFCTKPDPRPELVQEARGQMLKSADGKAGDPKGIATASIGSGGALDRTSGSDLARRAIDDGKAQGEEQRSALGAQQGAAKPPVAFKVLNTPSATAGEERQSNEPVGLEPPAKIGDTAFKAKDPETKQKTQPGPAKTPSADKKSAAAKSPPLQIASAAGSAAKPLAEPAPAAGQKCRVWTASYGGQKALIIRSVVDTVINFTVLDVNDGAEAREADAFISAYAKNGSIAGEFGSQSQALEKAFELCPEG